MTVEENKATVRRFIDNFNKKDAETLARNFAEDYVLDFPGGPIAEGIDGGRQATSGFIGTFPDLRFATDDLFADRDRVVWRWTMTGTHNDDLGPIPPSGKSVTLTGISMLRLRDGKITEDKVRADMVGLLQQIGAMPEPEQGGS